MNFNFDYKHTSMIKGVLIILMLIHHALDKNMIFLHNVSTIIKNPDTLQSIVTFSKVCVGGFCFLSAYGMCRKYISLSSDLSVENYSKISLQRLVNLYFSFWPIYIIGFATMLLFSYAPISSIYLNPNTNQFSIFSLILDFFGIANLFSTPTINPSWWYMSIYLLLIVFTPLLNEFYKKYKCLSVIASFAVVFFVSQYLYAIPIMMLGIWAAHENILEKIRFFGQKNIAKTLIKYLLCLISIGISYILVITTNIYLAMPFITLPVIIFSNETFTKLPILRSLLLYIGKHSGNIFFIHYFIYEWCFSAVVYKFHYSILIILILLCSSLLVSVLLELCKKIMRYNKLEQSVISHLNTLIYK